MFLQLHEREDRERRVRRAQSLLSEATKTRTAAEGRKPYPTLPEPQITPQRGVYEDLYSPKGYRGFKLVTSTGAMGSLLFPSEWVTEAFIANLWKRLDAVDRPSLKLLSSSP